MEQMNENETSDSGDQGPGVDSLRHWRGSRQENLLQANELGWHNCLACMGRYKPDSGDNMNITLLTKVRQLFNVDYVPNSTNRHNQRQYIRALRILGDRWLIHKDNQVQKIAQWLLFIQFLHLMRWWLLGQYGSIWVKRMKGKRHCLARVAHHVMGTAIRAETVRQEYEE